MRALGGSWGWPGWHGWLLVICYLCFVFRSTHLHLRVRLDHTPVTRSLVTFR